MRKDSGHPAETTAQNDRGNRLKVVPMQDITLDDCVRQSRRQKVVLTRRGKPIALVVGIKGMDLEQVELSLDPEFWKLIEERRKQPTITHEELLKQLDEWDRQQSCKPSKKKQKTS